jgi:hypothetical protein
MQRIKVPPLNKTQRRRSYGLIGRANTATSDAQRAHLLCLAEALMEWRTVETVGADAPGARVDDVAEGAADHGRF